MVITLAHGMSEKGMYGWNKVLRNQYGFHLQDAGHLQQSRNPEVASTFDPGNGALRLPDTRTQVGLRQSLRLAGFPDLSLNICHAIC